MTEQIQVLWRRLEYISRDLKVRWIAQKVFSMYLGGNRRWVRCIEFYQQAANKLGSNQINGRKTIQTRLKNYVNIP